MAEPVGAKRRMAKKNTPTACFWCAIRRGRSSNVPVTHLIARESLRGEAEHPATAEPVGAKRRMAKKNTPTACFWERTPKKIFSKKLFFYNLNDKREFAQLLIFIRNRNIKPLAQKSYIMNIIFIMLIS